LTFDIPLLIYCSFFSGMLYYDITMKIKSLLVSLLIFLFPISLIFADTLYLKNGRNLEGIIKSEAGDHVELDVGFGTVTFDKAAIERMHKSSGTEISEIRNKWEINKARSEIIRARAEEERQKSITDWKERKAKEELEERKRKEYSPKEVSVQKEFGHMVVDAFINKKVMATLVVDTGASIVLLTEEIAKKLGIDLERDGAPIQMQVADGRKVDARYVVLDYVKVNDAVAENVEAAVLKDNEQKLTYKDGLLGMSFLRKFNFKFDYEKDKLILEKIK